jgi:hypothetical protein
MPIQTDLSVEPYFDDFNESSNYHKILFKPGVALQTREINQLQTILQNQVEKFGDNIFKKGSIIDGCNFTYDSQYPYAKIKDLQVDGEPVALGNYVGLFAKNSSNLVARIISANNGFESQAPDLSTLFLHYVNSGDTSELTAFAQNQVLTVYNANVSVYQVNIPVNGTGQGFSNGDSVVFLSSITVPDDTVVSVNDTINDPVSLANAVVLAVNATAINSSKVLKLRPYANSLTDNSVNASSWTFRVGNTVLVNNTTSTIIDGIIGSGANADVITNSSGVITEIVMTDLGQGYDFAPYVTIKTSNTSASVTNLNLTAQNYLAQVTIANNAQSGSSNAVGFGYAFSITEGIVYQKGYFLFVSPQTIVVDKYSSKPDAISVGFSTVESIVTSDIDPTLLDNSTGTFNTQAPGADRLKLVPGLILQDTAVAEANSDFFIITAFSLGQPYLQNQQTAYSLIGDEMSKRTSDTSGNFVIDPFILSTITPEDVVDEHEKFRVTIDPGYAYISGNRVKTDRNYSLVLDQGIYTQNSTGVAVNLNYGNYTKVKEVGGVFDYTVGDYVTLYNAAKNYLSFAGNSTVSAYYSNSNTAPKGTAIGTARIRSMSLDSGTPGDASAVYKLYLYDINMNQTKNFRDVRAVYYSSANYDGIADIVAVNDASTNTYIATIANTEISQMVFDSGAASTKSTANIVYSFKSLSTVNAGNNGTIQVSLAGSNYFSYTADSTLSQEQLKTVQLVFTSNAEAQTNLTGTFVVGSSSNVISANSSTLNFIATFNSGDFVKIYQASTTEIKKITAVLNSTAFQIDAPPAASNSAVNVKFFFPENAPVPLHTRTTTRSANVDSSGQLLTINIGTNLASNSSAATVTYNAKSVNAAPVAKTTNRETTVVINPSKNPGAYTGPWALGQPDIFRLRKVYKDTRYNIVDSNSDVITISFSTTSGAFSNGETVTQHSGMYNLNISSINGAFTNGEYVYQANSTANVAGGIILSVNSTVMVVNTLPFVGLTDFTGFTNSTSVIGEVSGANSTVDLVTSNVISLGTITSIGNNGRIIRNGFTTKLVQTINVANTIAVIKGSNVAGVSSLAYGEVDHYNYSQYVKVTELPSTAVDVTNDFYIDHNQNLDYYDYGYLYKKPKSLLNVSDADVFIVSYDHFTNAAAGVFTRSSYNVNDTQNYDTLTGTLTGGSISTHEVPELFTTKGTNVDLIDAVDFRPRVVATAAITAGNIALSTVNPPVPSAIEKFQATTTVFPVPSSQYTSDFEHHLARVDRIVIDKDGIIKAVTGTPGVNNLSAPPEPKDSMTINLLFIPAYPSVPQRLSNNYINIIDKGIANDKFTQRRIQDHTIAVPLLSKTQIEKNQPTRFTMADIANLERRIAALEYYVSLSQLEQSLKDITIPSSISSSINRFKYGFFADSFDTTLYSDVNNPEYLAKIQNSEVVARTYNKNVEFDFHSSDLDTANSTNGKYVSLPYRYANGVTSSFTLLTQGIATDGAVVVSNNQSNNQQSNNTPVTSYTGIMTASPSSFSIDTEYVVSKVYIPPVPESVPGASYWSSFITDTPIAPPQFTSATARGGIKTGGIGTAYITVQTYNVADGTTLYWTTRDIGFNVLASDFSDNTLSGTCTIQNNNATVTRKGAAQNTPISPSVKSFNIDFHTGSGTGPIVTVTAPISLYDASVFGGNSSSTVSYSVTILSNKSSNPHSIDEGNYVATATVRTTGVSDNTTLYWSTYVSSSAGLTAADFTDGTLTGTVVINSGQGTFTRAVKADSTTEGTESFGVKIHTGSVSGPVVAETGIVMSINDSSLTPRPPPPTYSNRALVVGTSATTEQTPPPFAAMVNYPSTTIIKADAKLEYRNWVVPANVHRIKYKIWGAGGGGGGTDYNDGPGIGASGGSGAYVEGFANVTPGETLLVVAGGGGLKGGTGGTPPGGATYSDGANGKGRGAIAGGTRATSSTHGCGGGGGGGGASGIARGATVVAIAPGGNGGGGGKADSSGIGYGGTGGGNSGQSAANAAGAGASPNGRSGLSGGTAKKHEGSQVGGIPSLPDGAAEDGLGSGQYAVGCGGRSDQDGKHGRVVIYI